MRVDGDRELRMRHRKRTEGSEWCDRGTYNGQKRNIYIESEERQTKMHWAREVHNRASPNRSRETDETLGIDLMQKCEGWMASGWEWVWISGIDLTRGRGKVEGALGRECVGWMQGSRSVRECIAETRGVRGFGDALDASWLGVEPEGSGLALGAQKWFWWLGMDIDRSE